MKKFKILLIGNYLPDKQESMQRFTDLLLESLKYYNHEVELIRPTVKVNRSQASFEDKGRWWGYIDKMILFPFRLRRAARRADIVHICDHSNAFYIKTIRNQPHVINCHDVIAIRSALDPSLASKRSGKILQNLILTGLKRANHFACISENTRKELLEVAKVDPAKAEVIYMGINYPFSPMERSEALRVLSPLSIANSDHDFTQPFVFHVGGNQPYKNRLGVLGIYNELRNAKTGEVLPKLIMVGKPFDDAMREFIALNGLQAQVIEIQKCSNEQMRALYSIARVFLFPSLAEGFGWPVIEAQACGCPVLTSNFAPLTEVGGDAAIYCDPRDEKAASIQLELLLNESEEPRKRRIDDGLENIKRFTPQTMIEGYLALYQKAIDNHRKTSK